MSLKQARVCAQVAVSDMAQARAFYEGKLGLVAGTSPNEANAVYTCGDGSALYLYAAPAHAGKATGTVARWDVDNIEQAVNELAARGVTFERYGPPTPTDPHGIHDSGYGKVAWFKDPDGNTFALEQV
jgi:catechol 2,3-dioxygenase-like lactoylglutathione lyase family enzyme